jgi:hypothetical protein
MGRARCPARRACAAEAERERRARIITADGEYQASKRLAAAANVMARDPAALQLRLLQTVAEVAAEKNSTLVMPAPVELLRFFEKMAPAAPAAGPSASLADFGDAEAAEGGPAPSPAPPPPGRGPCHRQSRPPCRRWRRSASRRCRHRRSNLPTSPRTQSTPYGRRRRQGRGQPPAPCRSGVGIVLAVTQVAELRWRGLTTCGRSAGGLVDGVRRARRGRLG